jgi:hypothetical protein
MTRGDIPDTGVSIPARIVIQDIAALAIGFGK